MAPEDFGMGEAFGTDEFADNPEPRVACVLLLDTSGSMLGQPIAELNGGLAVLWRELLDDPLASLRVELSLVTFGGNAEVLQPFVPVADFSPPNLCASGNTPLGQAIQLAMDLVRQRKNDYRANGVAYYRPWIFVITDGAPTDDWETAAAGLQAAAQRKELAVFCVGVTGADFDVLARLSTSVPLRLQGLKFRELFQWLSTSLRSVSQSHPDEETKLSSPMGWGSV